MSMLICSRGNCTNIMCERLSPTWGYLCDECFKELVDTNTTDITSFMETNPTPDRGISVEQREFYAELFPSV